MLKHANSRGAPAGPRLQHTSPNVLGWFSGCCGLGNPLVLLSSFLCVFSPFPFSRRRFGAGCFPRLRPGAALRPGHPSAPISEAPEQPAHPGAPALAALPPGAEGPEAQVRLRRRGLEPRGSRGRPLVWRENLRRVLGQRNKS